MHLVHEHIFRQSNHAHKKKSRKKDDMKRGWSDGSVDILSKVELDAASGSKHPTRVITVKPHEECQGPMMSAWRRCRAGCQPCERLGQKSGLLWIAIMFRTPDFPRHRFFSGQHQQLFLEAEPSSFPLLAELK